MMATSLVMVWGGSIGKRETFDPLSLISFREGKPLIDILRKIGVHVSIERE